MKSRYFRRNRANLEDTTMDYNNMFCFQCEQTASCTDCTGKAGVCGKSAEVANLQDELTDKLIGLARATDGNEKVDARTWKLIIEGLCILRRPLRAHGRLRYARALERR